MSQASLRRLPAILVVDDEVRSQEALRRTLEEDFEVFCASGAADGLEVLEREQFTAAIRIVLCDQRMPGTTGVEFLKEVRLRWPDVVRIILSGYSDAEDIISGVNEAGIWQYLLKPWQPEQLLLTLQRAAEVWRLQQENQRLTLDLRCAEPVLKKRVDSKQEKVKIRFGLGALIRAPGSPLDAVCALVRRVAPYDLSVMVTGESGTGKEMVARAIHYESRRADRPFITENCGALPDSLLESELFGYKRGAFTGAVEDRVGLFQQADGGTLFLDEIGETSPAFQVKLLRVLQEGEFRPLGSNRAVNVDVRVIAATNRDLEEDVRTGRFREDLYYRLATISLHVAPLRERPMDLPLLARHLLQTSARALDKAADGFSEAALAGLSAYRWPGNVRELQNEILRMVALADSVLLGADLLSPRLLGARSNDALAADAAQVADGLTGGLRERMDQLEQRVLKEAMGRHRGNKSRAARELGLSRVGLRSKLVRYGLEPAE
ncbi:sigma-54-dependent transcriptional regulator [Dechloromonas denitrificans]|uniref:sigma-54-dependent transcriptional regulator n=1 Tax=Dechloromonas denitrificans TaxID=281362 RepID=UPI001CF84014|nr:sigma-54 dependent transcriptional regulator [Dechloromonas denitrificans]UCV03496.1 sigma-54-dependent Fis family transcriptional regulator [Dechloromonas denitrificans]